MPEVHAQLIEILATLERHYRDMQDVEFTIEEGTLYMLQTRNAKRPAQAAVRVAVDMVERGPADAGGGARCGSTPDKLDALLHPTFDPALRVRAAGARACRARPAPPRARSSSPPTRRSSAAANGEAVILVRPFTEADDVAGFHAARGHPHLRGRQGLARGARRARHGPARACAAPRSCRSTSRPGRCAVNGTVLQAGDLIAIDGTHRRRHDRGRAARRARDQRALRDGARLGRRDPHGWACARTPTRPRTRAARASFGAEGIGLCRTEHMFMQADRQPKMRAMIMADDRGRAARGARRAAAAPARGLRGHLRGDGGPAGHDPAARPAAARVPAQQGGAAGGARAPRARRRRRRRIAELEAQLDRVRELEETNPMLGTRGCRLGILYPEIYEMQVRAIVGAALAVRERTRHAARGRDHDPAGRLRAGAGADARAGRARRRAQRSSEAGAEPLAFTVGTMIELPRACLVADRIAAHADFFSFGTNDLTQTALGFSRDDVERKLPRARTSSSRIVDRSPFETIDVPGVGALVRMAVETGRAANPRPQARRLRRARRRPRQHRTSSTRSGSTT